MYSSYRLRDLRTCSESKQIFGSGCAATLANGLHSMMRWFIDLLICGQYVAATLAILTCWQEPKNVGYNQNVQYRSQKSRNIQTSSKPLSIHKSQTEGDVNAGGPPPTGDNWAQATTAPNDGLKVRITAIFLTVKHQHR